MPNKDFDQRLNAILGEPTSTTPKTYSGRDRVEYEKRLEKLLNAPKTEATFYSNEQYQPAIIDDIDKLSTYESIWDGIFSIGEASWNKVQKIKQAFDNQVRTGAHRAVQGIYENIGEASLMMAPETYIIPDLSSDSPTLPTGKSEFMRIAEYASKVVDIHKRKADARDAGLPSYKVFSEDWAEGIAGGVGRSIPAMALATITRGMGASANASYMMMGASVPVSEKYNEYRAEGINESISATIAFSQAAMEGLTEKMGGLFDVAKAPGKGLAKSVLHNINDNFWKEQLGEQFATGYEMTVDDAFLNRGYTPLDYLKASIETAIVTTAIGSGVSVVGKTVDTVDKIMTNRQLAKLSELHSDMTALQSAQNLLLAQETLSSSSALKDDGLHTELVDRIKGENGKISIDAEVLFQSINNNKTLKEYFENNNEKMELIKKLSASKSEYTLTSEDLVSAMKSENFALMIPDLRVNNGKTAREVNTKMQVSKKELSEAQEALRARAQRNVDIKAIEDEAFTQLKGTTNLQVDGKPATDDYLKAVANNYARAISNIQKNSGLSLEQVKSTMETKFGNWETLAAEYAGLPSEIHDFEKQYDIEAFLSKEQEIDIVDLQKNVQKIATKYNVSYELALGMYERAYNDFNKKMAEEALADIGTAIAGARYVDEYGQTSGYSSGTELQLDLSGSPEYKSNKKGTIASAKAIMKAFIAGEQLNNDQLAWAKEQVDRVKNAYSVLGGKNILNDEMLTETMKTAKYGNMVENPYVAEDDYSDVPFQSAEDSTKRGYFRKKTGLMNASHIALGKASDLSTAFHELGHLYLTTILELAKDPNASESLKLDAKVIMSRLNDVTKENNETPSIKQQEAFADMYWGYLASGKAPTKELQSVFRRFTKWLGNLWKSFADKAKVPADIADVFDRILATREEVNEFKNSNGLDISELIPQLKNLESGKEKKLVQKVQNEIDGMYEDMLANTISEYKQSLNTEYRNELRRLEFEALLNYRDKYGPIVSFLAELEIGAITENGLKIAFTPEQLASLPKYFAEFNASESDGGIPLQIALTTKNFTGTIEEFIAGVKNNPTRVKTLASKKAAQIMRDEYSDILNSGVEYDLAIEAMTDRRLALLNTLDIELIALLAEKESKIKDLDQTIKYNEAEKNSLLDIERAKKHTEINRMRDILARNISRYSDVKSLAESIVKDMPRSEIEAFYRNSLSRAKTMASDIIKYAKAKDYVKMAEARNEQMMHIAKSIEAKKAMRIFSTSDRLMKRLAKKSKIESLSKQDPEIANHIQNILISFGVIDFDKKLLFEENIMMTTYSEWVENLQNEWQMDMNHLTPDIIFNPNNMLALNPTQTQEVTNVLRGLEQIAKLNNSWKVHEQKKEMENIRKQLENDTSHITDRTQRRGVFNIFLDKANKFFDEHMLIEHLIRIADNFNINGNLFKAILKPIFEADAIKNEMLEKIKAVNNSLNDIRGKMPKEDFTLSTLGNKKISVDEVIAFILHFGSVEGQQSLKSGGILLREGKNVPDVKNRTTYTDETANEILNIANSNPNIIRLCNAIWESNEVLFPYVSRAYTEKTGLVPYRVTAIPLLDGKLTGGYFPMSYVQNPSMAPGTELFDYDTDNMYSSMIKRNDNLSDRFMVDLDWSSAYLIHLETSLRAGAYGTAYRKVKYVLYDREIETILVNKFGRERYNILKKWLDISVEKRSRDNNAKAVEGLITAILRNVITSALQLKFVLAIANYPSGVVAIFSDPNLSRKNLTVGMMRFGIGCVKMMMGLGGVSTLYKELYAKSDYFRTICTEYDSDKNSIASFTADKITLLEKAEKISKWGMAIHKWSAIMVALTAAEIVKNKEIDGTIPRGMSWIEYFEMEMRTTQMGVEKSQKSVAHSTATGINKFLNYTFVGPLLVLFSNAKTTCDKYGWKLLIDRKGFAQFASAAIVPNLVFAIIMNKLKWGEDDDDEEKVTDLTKFITLAITSTMETLPVFGRSMSAMTRFYALGESTVRGSGLIVDEAGWRILDTAKYLYKASFSEATAEEVNEYLFKASLSSIRLVGLTLPLPTSYTANTIKNWYEFYESGSREWNLESDWFWTLKHGMGGVPNPKDKKE